MKPVKLKVNEYNNDEIERISKRFNLSKTSAKILLNRNIKSFDDIEQFLEPNFKYFERAENYKDLHKGCKRVIEAINNNDRILIYGDYDVDGVTSISQFVVFLKKAGAYVNYYVPERESEGYGISSDFVNSVKSGEINFELLITVDCGIAEIEKIDEITKLDKDVIIIDHHESREELPNAYAIINPKQKDCPSENKHLCAAGLSFKFLINLNKFLKIDNIEDVLLEYACLGTIADIVDLVKDNRIIASQGLKKINKTKIIGLKKLIEVSGINGEIKSYHIGFILAPRINASGRMDTAKKAIKLMLTKDEEEAEKLASELDSLNNARKEAENIIYKEAIKKIESDFLYKNNVMVVYGDNWHEGVLGIVASRLTEKYYKPCVVISVKDGIGKGSARSVEHVDIFESFKHTDIYLEKYGGHKLAAGLTILEKNINSFTNELNNYIGSTTDDEYNQIRADAILNISDINLRLYDEINRFEPFGSGNPKPLLALRDVSIKNIRKVGKEGKHISFMLSDGDRHIPVIGFCKIGILEKILTMPQSYIVSLSENIYNGSRSLQLFLHDVEEHEEFDYKIDVNKLKALEFLINKTKSKIIKTDLFILVEKLNKRYNTKITAEEIICMLKKADNIQFALKNDILYIKK
ncbi:MAG TPA: single-stranded-DNA-specific exonuclease RecJ [Sedimentibacter sp.]|jgi:single-stranded-DNA-specific exonuclease|nr:single-stranded-DNA-specific exonuclease RecJ [Sedimentibacter sp.]NLA13945.1 single-stranded-DNA-specific exonuclease RecJ [Tissierellia bacterium]HOG62435.1 single-stranded-DNA-specific exonuclease RecJ [Sedimentibacter sp.]HOT22325.1 single-stranded-DNA-specific exonuclease RecJ [Sedimentibacter sp.]HPB80083.1 single-stranded-DNA-specific exonuclease RecJ [Sedimentibacter sp.]